MYRAERLKLMRNLPIGIIVSTELLLTGDPSLSDKENSVIFRAVQEYIRETTTRGRKEK